MERSNKQPPSSQPLGLHYYSQIFHLNRFCKTHFPRCEGKLLAALTINHYWRLMFCFHTILLWTSWLHRASIISDALLSKLIHTNY